MIGRSQLNAKAVAYARVSTLLGQDPANQLLPIRQFVDAREMQLVEEYVDRGISGAKEKRPSLDRMIADARRGRFKIIVVAALDRLSRSTRHFLNLVSELDSYGVRLVSLRENLDYTTPTGQMVLTILAAVATLERQIIAERIKNALAARKIAAQQNGSGWKCGRPTVITEAVRDEVIALRRDGLSIRNIERRLGRKVSRTTITRLLRGYR